MMSETSTPNKASKGPRETANPKGARDETPIVRAERAYQIIQRTVGINDKLRQLGLISNSLMTKKVHSR